uniref:HMG box domain-containing protein n=1 Tax=Ditylum brightwellii TaxID=49249 RepID=A0A7S4R1H4_9STRA
MKRFFSMMSSLHEDSSKTQSIRSSAPLGSIPEVYSERLDPSKCILPLTTTRTNCSKHRQLNLSPYLPPCVLPTLPPHQLLPSLMLLPFPPLFSSFSPIGRKQLAASIASTNAAAARSPLLFAQQEYTTEAMKCGSFIQREAASVYNKFLPLTQPMHQIVSIVLPTTYIHKTHCEEPSTAFFSAEHPFFHCSSDQILEAAHHVPKSSRQGDRSLYSNLMSMPNKNALAMFKPQSASSDARLFIQNQKKKERYAVVDILPHKEEEVKVFEQNKKRNHTALSEMSTIGRVQHDDTQEHNEDRNTSLPSLCTKDHHIPKEVMPRRPFNAYNLFFSEEREKILISLPGGKDDERLDTREHMPLDDVKSNQPWATVPLLQKLAKRHVLTKRRPHRKSHGKIGFKELTKVVASRWRKLPSERVEYYKDLAQMDLERYRLEMQCRSSRGYASHKNKRFPLDKK